MSSRLLFSKGDSGVCRGIRGHTPRKFRNLGALRFCRAHMGSLYYVSFVDTFKESLKLSLILIL